MKCSGAPIWDCCLVLLSMAAYFVSGSVWLYNATRYVPESRECATLLPAEDALLVNLNSENGYLPPTAFDYNVKVIPLHGRWLLAWDGADMWLNYPPSKCVAVGPGELEVELCFGKGSHQTYRLRKDGERLVYAD
jgi:hypothetical protein